MSEKTVIVIAGPTAVGKTALSIALAQHFETAVISADSRQCYKEMSVGTAKPTANELACVKHYFINTHHITENLNAGDFERLSLTYLDEILKTRDVAIVCGGTGLYIKALCEGIDSMPPVSKTIEKHIQSMFETKGLQWLQNELRQKDPVFFSQTDQQNHTRLIRGLAFFESNQSSITQYQHKTSKQRPFRIVKVAISLPREELYERINYRVEEMLRQGLMEEIAALWSYRTLKNMQTVGYKEFYQFGHWPLSSSEQQQAVEKIKQHSRNYAKRQLTWFRNDLSYHWFPADGYKEILDYVHHEIKK